MRFCVAILILKMEGNKQLFCILCFIISRKVKTPQMQNKVCAVCREGAVTDQMGQKWFTEFRAGDCSLDVAPQSGRPVEAYSDQIATLIENNQHYTTQEIADILRISKSIKLLVKMKRCRLQKKLNELLGPSDISRLVRVKSSVLCVCRA